jgi:hypothetical protein
LLSDGVFASGEQIDRQICIVLTQSSIVIMPRRPMIIFDETDVSGTVLLLTPLLKSTPLSPPFENNRELGREKVRFNRWRKSNATV